MHPNNLRRMVKELCRRNGVPGWETIRGHSLRIGTAQSMRRMGLSLADITHAGRWKSPAMPIHYTKALESGENPVHRLFRESGT